MKRFSTFTVLIFSTLAMVSCVTPPSDDLATPPVKEVFHDVVNTYMKLTLGSIPGATIDYDQAKTLLTPRLAAQFTTPMFIPASYCMQDGPSDVRVTSVAFNEDKNWANVIVVGAYHGGWIEMWDFTVVPVEGDDWMINDIECLHI